MQNSSVKNRLSVIMVTIVNNNSFTNGSELNYYNENESMCLVVLELYICFRKACGSDRTFSLSKVCNSCSPPACWYPLLLEPALRVHMVLRMHHGSCT